MRRGAEQGENGAGSHQSQSKPLMQAPVKMINQIRGSLLYWTPCLLKTTPFCLFPAMLQARRGLKRTAELIDSCELQHPSAGGNTGTTAQPAPGTRV